MSKIKNYKDFVNENNGAEPAVKPAPPRTTPGTTPRRDRPSPIRRDKPKVEPKPKAEAEDVINRFLDEASEEDKKEVMDKYEEA